MNKKELATRGASPSSWVLPPAPDSVPLRGAGVFKLPPGLHLMHGSKASGKTLTAIALAELLQADGSCPVSYAYLLEPRAALVQELVEQEAWDKFLNASLAASRTGILIVDSLTYLLNRLQAVVMLEEQIGRVTYKGGLTPRDIYSVLFTDQKAREANVALIGTINSDLFPVVDALEGACEGQIRLDAPGHLSYRNRSRRDEVSFTIPAHILNDVATSRLGYPARSALVSPTASRV